MSLFPCPDFVRKLIEYQKGIFSQVSHGHDGLLTLDDNGNFVTDKLFVRSYVDDPANNILGFETDTPVGNTYNPQSPFSKTVTGTAYFYAKDSHLIINSISSPITRLTWSSEFSKSKLEIAGFFSIRTVSPYWGEIRFWDVQNPGQNDPYWSIKLITDTSIDWPWRIQLFLGVGVTFSATDGTMVYDLPFDPRIRWIFEVSITSGGRFSLIMANEQAFFYVPTTLLYTDVNYPSSIKAVCINFDTVYQRAILDYVRVY